MRLSSSLNSVVALSATDVWAVGNYILPATPSSHTLIAHWDGTSWNVVPSPDVWGTLTSVAAVGAHDVRAVGFRNSDTPTSNVIGIARALGRRDVERGRSTYAAGRQRYMASHDCSERRGRLLDDGLLVHAQFELPLADRALLIVT